MTPPALTGDLKSYAEQLKQEEFERERKRDQQLQEQRSDLNPPHHRIRVWEQSHGLRMPGDPEHAVLEVIAVCTGLTLEQIQEEQRLRAARVAGRGQG